MARWRGVRTVVRLALAAGVLAACHAGSGGPQAPESVRMPRDAARFEITIATDSSVVFRTMEATWVRPGQQAYVVDPARGDALVARLDVVSHVGGRAVAVVTGQVGRVAESHVLLLVRPEVSWGRAFWRGAVYGALVGVVMGLLW